MRNPSITDRHGFSALQLLVVFTVLLMGMALLMPAIARVRAAAMASQSTNNLRQLGLAVHGYHDSYKQFPPTVGENAGQKGPAHFHILPFIEQNPIFQNANGAVWKNGVYGTVINVFLDPRDASLPGHVYKNWLATTNYPVNWMVMKDGRMRLVAITDGTSNTLMFAQRYQMCHGQPTAWGYPSMYLWAPMFGYYSEELFQSAPTQSECEPRRAQAIARDIQIALCDGSVRSLAPSIGPTTWYYLMDPADGNPLPADAF